MLSKILQCFTDHITVIMEGVQDGSWDGGAKECEGYKVGKGVGVCVHFRTKEQGGVWVEVIGGVRECEEQGGVWGCSADW